MNASSLSRQALESPGFSRGEDVNRHAPNPLHDHPLAASPMVAWYEAVERLDTGWMQAQCPDCKCFGWIAPDEEGKETNGTD